MKNHWTDDDLNRALQGLKDEPTGDVFWKDRVWSKIAEALPAEARKRLEKPWYRRPAVIRLGLVAACLMLAMGWWRVEQTSADSELSDFLSNLSTVEAGADPGTVQCTTQMGPVDNDDASLEMENVYDSL